MALRGILIFMILVVIGAVYAEHNGLDYERYSKTRVYSIDIQSKSQVAKVLKLTNKLQLEVLNPFEENNSFELAVGPRAQGEFEKFLYKNGIAFSAKIKDLKEMLDLRKPENVIPEMEWTQYHPVEHIFSWLEEQSKQHPFETSLLTLGHSYEGRPIQALKISRKPGNKAIVVECNMHAIEWIASASCTCFLNNLLNSHESKVQELTQNYDWIVIPLMNPDGLAYTRDVAPLWRKNRRPNGVETKLGSCTGTDMNRNFDFKWKVAGFNTNVSCSQFYAGTEPLSEPEVRALRDYIDSHKDGYIRIYIAVHSFGNKLLLPYGHTMEERPENYDQMLAISKGFADAARVKFGTDFTYGTSGELLYPVSASSKDWAYGVKNIPYTATLELRDEGEYGFFLPPNQILDVCAEITDGFVGLVEAAEEEGLFI